MSYILEKLPNEPIVCVKYNHDFKVAAQMEQVILEIITLLDAQPEPVFLITDTTEMTMGVDDLISATNKAVRQTKVVTHRNNRLNLVVSTNSLITFGVKGMNTAAFGYLKVEIFRTMDEALAFARSQRGK
jgi:hypothetical protein